MLDVKEFDMQLLSLHEDGSIILSDIHSGETLMIFDCEATVFEVDSTQTFFITGNKQGEILKWTVPKGDGELDSGVLLQVKHKGAIGNLQLTIDSLKLLKNGKVLSKSKDGKLMYWDLEGQKILFNIICRSLCKLDVTSDEDYFAIGNQSGGIEIYSLEDGSLASVIKHKRSTKPVIACAFARSSDNIVFVGQDSLIWRLDYRKPEETGTDAETTTA